ncbi:helix-turn-helix transcriptional regulator [Actinoallomurus spadix]|uniref:Helix-turn-helix transcriptional regulator n=2 Tax=Actinoallomurus spadix TaxID=79912 RepID=A0ABP3H2N1_9ACTN
MRALLELYGIVGAEREGLLQLAREARQPGWWHSFRDVLPDPYAAYIGFESAAASVQNFEPLVIPGLLQTEEYARATFHGGPRELDRDDVERRVQVRSTRQGILKQPQRPRLWAVIDEAAIRRVVGSPKIMREQLYRLMEAADEGRTTIQVVPFHAGAHAGTTGPFVILGFSEPADPNVVYIETLAGEIYLEAPEDVTLYTVAFDRLVAAALHPDESLALIGEAAKDLSE